ncbi:MAG: rhomboid family intramembrane serine protease [Thermodesulfobacteriota bacterium]
MIPIRDTIQARSYPFVNNAIIGINVAVYLVSLTQGDALHRFFVVYGLVPARYTVPEISQYFSFGRQAFSFISFMFLHGGFLHLLGNMWSLYIFGDNVEDRLGSIRYLAFYLLCGTLSGLSHLILNMHSQVPTVGASGAIAGVMGAYLILYPRSKILTLIPIFFIPYFIEIPAFVFLGIWFVLQFMSAAGPQAQSAGVAWWAHIGGFVFGILFLKLLLKTPHLGLSGRLRAVSPKRKTHHLQVIRTTGRPGDPNLYGRIRLTPTEARQGSRKLVNIPRGGRRRLFNVRIPQGVREGRILRLAGLGRKQVDGLIGDLMLEVEFEPDA